MPFADSPFARRRRGRLLIAASAAKGIFLDPESMLREKTASAEQPRPTASTALPRELAQLLQANSQAARDAAWAAFATDHSRLILRVARHVAPEHDAAMDAYAYVLEKLREDDFRRLAGFVADGRGKFTTWLVVVCRRLCLDFHRQRYGRSPRSTSLGNSQDERMVRRRLANLASEIDLSTLAAPDESADPDAELRRADLLTSLEHALSTLAPHDRLLVALRFHDGVTAKEIAKLLHYPSAFNVYRKINSVLAELRQRLERAGVYGSAP